MTTTHPTPPTPAWQPMPGTHLTGPDAIVIDRRHYRPPRPGRAANCAVLCIVPASFHPFVIWPSLSAACTVDTDGQYTQWLVTSSGEYYATLDEAHTAWTRQA